jgi:hypothetical protein
MDRLGYFGFGRCSVIMTTHDVAARGWLLVESAPLLFPSLSPVAPTCRGFFYCAKSPSLKGPPANVSFDSLMPNERGYLEFRGKDGDGGEIVIATILSFLARLAMC